MLHRLRGFAQQFMVAQSRVDTPILDPAADTAFTRDDVRVIFWMSRVKTKVPLRNRRSRLMADVWADVWRAVGRLRDGRYFYLKAWSWKYDKILRLRGRCVVALDPDLLTTMLPRRKQEMLRTRMDAEALQRRERCPTI